MDIPILHSLLAFLFARRVLVKGWSMYPTLAPGERVLFDALAYRRQEPRRGDVVLARHPSHLSMLLVKRVAAAPGDSVTAKDAEVVVEEPGSGNAPPPGADAAAAVWTLGEHEYFLVGDAPDLSTDARHFGPVGRQDILARAWLVYWPPRRFRAVRGLRAS